MTSEQLKELKKFINEYKEYYNQDEFIYIRQQLFSPNNNPLNLYINDNELVEIYTKLGFYDSKRDGFFHMNLKKLQDNFNLGCNVLDIGGGYLSVFSNLIAEQQLILGCGTVSAFDPKLIEKSIEYSNITAYKRAITLDDDVSRYDLIVGIYPCQASELIIELACKNHKDFYIALCGCEHYDEHSYYKYSEDAPYYYEYLACEAKKLVKKYDNGILVVDNFDSNIYPYPIIYNKRVKKPE